jgi:hypothetical protein
MSSWLTLFFSCFAGLPDDVEVFVRALCLLKLLLCLVWWNARLLLIVCSIGLVPLSCACVVMM